MTHYDTLGVAPSASSDEIKAAYRKLARQVHPDVDPNPAAGERFTAITEAYRVLSDPRRRLTYNQETLASQTTQPVTDRITPNELRAAWERVGAYGLTAAAAAAIFYGLLRWFIATPDPWQWQALAPTAGVGGLIGLMWGIDANFVTSDFLPTALSRLAARLVRSCIWMGGLGFLGLTLATAVKDATSWAVLSLGNFTIGATLVGAVIALLVTIRDQ